MANEKMVGYGSKRSVIRELFEYGRQRAAIVGADNVYDYSLGNPAVPAPDSVQQTIRDLMDSDQLMQVHGYTWQIISTKPTERILAQIISI